MKRIEHYFNWNVFESKALRERVQIRSFFSSVFPRIQTEYRKIRTRKNSVFGHFSHSKGFLLGSSLMILITSSY